MASAKLLIVAIFLSTFTFWEIAPTIAKPLPPIERYHVVMRRILTERNVEEPEFDCIPVNIAIFESDDEKYLTIDGTEFIRSDINNKYGIDEEYYSYNSVEDRAKHNAVKFPVKLIQAEPRITILYDTGLFLNTITNQKETSLAPSGYLHSHEYQVARRLDC